MKIELVKWNINNIKELQKICNEVDRTFLSNRVPYPYSENHALEWIDYVEKNEGVHGVFRAIVVDGEYAGNISVEKKDDVYCKNGEIGYMLLTSYWSKGIMSQAVKEICKIAFQELDIVRLTGLVYENNFASRKVLEKNDFCLEGIQRKAVYKKEQFYDLCIYGRLK